MVDMVYYLIALFSLCAVCFYAGVEFTAGLYHRERKKRK